MDKSPLVANARHNVLIAGDGVIQTHNKKFCTASDRLLQTQDRVAKAQQTPITISSQFFANNQHWMIDIEKAQKAEAKALADFAKAELVGTSLSHSGSGKVVVLLPLDYEQGQK